MSDDEEDYLSDKFLLQPEVSPSTKPTTQTYTQRRREAERISALRNEQNRKKSRKQLELESRTEGLSRSLFEKAKEEESHGGQQNKALAMMMKMGFRPGQALGKDNDHKDDDEPASSSSTMLPLVAQEEAEGRTNASSKDSDPGSPPPERSALKHRTVPLPLNEWAGKKGIGLGKRAASPSASERLAKMAKLAEDQNHTSFRDRARLEYENRKAEGQLNPAQNTCYSLDEKADVKFNVLWLHPSNPDAFPAGLLEALDDPEVHAILRQQHPDRSVEGRMRLKMEADALKPLNDDLGDPDAPSSSRETLREYSEDDLQEVSQFLRLPAKDRLALVLEYLRRKYCYCFWCGTQYEDGDDMESSCPGTEEDDHD